MDACRELLMTRIFATDFYHHLHQILILLWKVFLKMFNDLLKLLICKDLWWVLNDTTKCLTTGMLLWRAYHFKQLLSGTYCRLPWY